MTTPYETLEVAEDRGVCFITISNPPVNVMTLPLYQDLVRVTEEVEHNESIKVVVFQSADPEFFIAHFDVEMILTFPTDSEPVKSESLSAFHLMCERVRTMPKATLVKLAGRAGGGGNEFAASCDMRFGVKNKTIINQMEVPLGILPGGSGTQRLPRLVGRGRALEICLGGDDIDAQTCVDWGYLNRIFDSSEDMSGFVDRLAYRIAKWPPEAIALCKQSINNAELPVVDGLLEEAHLFQQTLRTQGAQENMRRALVLGLQTREGESRMGELAEAIAEGDA
jgi:enoyl-CoA hydratase/carnithine racemase